MVARALAKRPDDRFATMAELSRALDPAPPPDHGATARIARPPKRQRLHIWIAAAVVALLCLVAGSAAWFTNGAPALATEVDSSPSVEPLPEPMPEPVPEITEAPEPEITEAPEPKPEAIADPPPEPPRHTPRERSTRQRSTRRVRARRPAYNPRGYR